MIVRKQKVKPALELAVTEQVNSMLGKRVTNQSFGTLKSARPRVGAGLLAL